MKLILIKPKLMFYIYRTNSIHEQMLISWICTMLLNHSCKFVNHSTIFDKHNSIEQKEPSYLYSILTSLGGFCARGLWSTRQGDLGYFWSCRQGETQAAQAAILPKMGEKSTPVIPPKLWQTRLMSVAPQPATNGRGEPRERGFLPSPFGSPLGSTLSLRPDFINRSTFQPTKSTKSAVIRALVQNEGSDLAADDGGTVLNHHISMT